MTIPHIALCARQAYIFSFISQTTTCIEIHRYRELQSYLQIHVYTITVTQKWTHTFIYGIYHFT
jgi:hypothetical protein